MTRQIISIGSQANDGTGDTLRDGAVKINSNFQEIYETFGPDGLIIGTRIDFDSASLNFLDVSLTNATNLSAEGPTQNNFIVFPDYSANVVLDSASQTLLNKSLDSCVLINPLIADASQTHYYNVKSGELSASHNVYLPILTDSDTFVVANQTQTIKNKTLDSCSIINAIIPDGDWNDASGNTILSFDNAVNAVDYIVIRNADAGTSVDLETRGSSGNIDLRLLPKGSGAVELAGNVVFGDGTIPPLNTTGQALATNEPFLIISYNGGSETYTLPNGVSKGQVIYILNQAAGQNHTISPTTFAQGSSFTLNSNTIAHMLWDGSTWYVINQSDVTITP
jgi:hypothetical protein